MKGFFHHSRGASVEELRGLKREVEIPMPAVEEYDVLVLGSGEGGKFIAWDQATRGKRTAVVERRYVGGSCPNIACLPSKNVIHAAKVANHVRRGTEFGVHPGEWRVDMAAVRDRKRKMVDGLIAMHRGKFEGSGAELVMGHGRFVAPKTIEVAAFGGGTRTIRGEVVIINTGSRPRIDATPGLAEAQPMTHVEALELDRVPEHLLVLGGGYVGLELAQAMRRFGSRVTVIERNGSLAHREDPDVSQGLRELFDDEGIEVRTDFHVDRVEGRSGESVRLNSAAGETIEGSDLLAASGRTPNTNGIGLESAGVELDGRGYIQVDERLQTTAPGVWAVGDCTGGPQFTHVSYHDYCVVRDNLNGGDRVTTGRLVPSCMFTDPELARVGLSETEAKRRGIAFRLAKIPITAVLRTWTLSESRGFYKALIAADSDRILGFTAFGPEAGEIMAVVQVAISAEIPYTALRDSIIAHPTMAEGLLGLFSQVPAR
jgi:pyruvate/2-oxoglutarate dehydrogenase complex dihydrolipoamide dehydrogenase (E3) component